MPEHPQHPPFSSLPLNKGDPPHSAWGLWGKDDQLGTLNYLTEENTRAAASEITEGIRVGLNWTFGEPSRPCFERQMCEHKVLS
jgi:hypothetical protein